MFHKVYLGVDLASPTETDSIFYVQGRVLHPVDHAWLVVGVNGRGVVTGRRLRNCVYGLA